MVLFSQTNQENTVNEFALSVGLGSALGLWQIARTAPPQKALINVQVGLLSLLGGLIGSRAIFILTHYAYFWDHPGETVQFWLGGLSWPGAVLGVIAGAAIIALAKRLPIGKLLDDLSPMLPPLTIAIWLGCWQAGCAYGVVMPETAFWGIASPNETGDVLKRFPIQLLASLTFLLYFLWLEIWIKNNAFPGRKACLSGLGISGMMGLYSLLRADPTPRWLGLRLETWAGMGFFLFFLVAWIINIQKQKRTEKIIRNAL